MSQTATLDTPTGRLRITASEDAIIGITWDDGIEAIPPEGPALVEAARQLDEYFAGKRTEFDLPLEFEGEALQLGVWKAMQAIPFGETRTYGDIADELGASARSVGQACGQNRIPIVIPCHRVVGADGKLTGFSGGAGVETKRQLLILEGRLLI